MLVKRFVRLMALGAVLFISSQTASAQNPCCEDASADCSGIEITTCDCCEGGGLLGAGIIQKSERCFAEFISPMTNPVNFEDPRTLTEARVIFLNHQIPVLPGLTTTTDDVQLYAVQLRAALTEKLSLIATKDGYIVSDSPLIDDGFADVSLGLKYNVFRDDCSQTLVSTGFTYELPVGSTRSLQGNGDGEFHLFATGMTQLTSEWRWISAGGIRLPADTNAESQMSYWSNHFDRKVVGNLYFLTEFNWYHWLRSGNAFPAGVEGGDLFNLGSNNVAGNDIVTGAVGVKIKRNALRELGVAFEVPLTERRDVIDNRITADWIIRF